MLFHDADREQKAKKTRPSRSTPYPARPSPFPPPTSSNAPRLPNELLTQILKDLKRDKATLATCMRVSLLFNQLAAPLLYRSVHVSSQLADSDRHPFAIPKSTVSLSRLSSSKADNLKLVKYVTIKRHDADKCHAAIGPMQSERASKSAAIDVSCLRFDVSYGRGYAHPGVHYRFGDYCGLDMRCGVLSRFTPKTLVFNGVLGDAPLHGCVIPAKGTKTVVAIITWGETYRQYNTGPGHRGDPIDHIIYIVWENMKVYRREPAHIVHGILKGFDTGIAKSHTVVNGGHSVVQEMRNRRKSAMSSFSFIGKKDYLATHDWKGVLTPEQVEIWLSRPSN